MGPGWGAGLGSWMLGWAGGGGLREGGRGESYARITRNVLLDFGGGCIRLQHALRGVCHQLWHASDGPCAVTYCCCCCRMFLFRDEDLLGILTE